MDLARGLDTLLVAAAVAALARWWWPCSPGLASPRRWSCSPVACHPPARELSRGRGRKTGVLDAAAAAGIAALQGDTAQLQPDDTTVVLAVLEERRSNLVGQRTRSVNQLHAVLRGLSPTVPHLSSAPTRPPRWSARSDP